jgi:hypothetical protein
LFPHAHLFYLKPLLRHGWPPCLLPHDNSRSLATSGLLPKHM